MNCIVILGKLSFVLEVSGKSFIADVLVSRQV